MAAAAVAQPVGLDAIGDEKLFNELANRDLGVLLDRAFDVAKTPADQKRVMLGRMTLLRLKDNPPGDLLETRRLVATYVEALPQILPTMNDPTALIGDANLLIDHGVAADQSVLEYFGPSPGAASRLRPVAGAVRQLLAKAAERADSVCRAAVNNWPAMEKAWDVADEQKTIANYTHAIVAYPLALATGRADASREPMLNEAVSALAPFDSDDNPDRASVKFFIAKLNLARGTPDALTAAAEGFAFAITHGRPDDVRQQFDARLLTVSVRLAQKQLSAADTAMEEFLRWSRGAGLDAGVIDVAVSGVRFRQALAAGKSDAADDELDRLQQARPQMRGLILELIATRLSNDTPAAKLNALGLQARLARAETETLRPTGQTFDRPAIERGIEAATELQRRQNISAAVLDSTRYVLPFFLQKLNRNAEAATAFLDYVDAIKSTGKSDRLTTAFDQAISIVGAMFRAAPDDPAVTKLYDRALRTAVAPPLARLEFAYEYARRLQASGRADDAVAAFRTVPAADRNFAESRYYLMVALRQRLDTLPPTDPKRPASLNELAELADVVSKSIAERLQNAPTPAAATLDRTRLAQTRLLSADIALREQKDPARAAGALDDFEGVARGLGNEPDLLGEALLIRVQAYVQLGDVGRATDQLVTLAKQNPANAGQVVYNLLEKLEGQVTGAEAAGRADEVARLERDRAMLTPFLVTWAQDHADGRIRRLTYTYRVFDADTQRRAAEATSDPAERKRLLDASLQRFQALDTKPNVTAYLDALPPERRARARYDPQVKLGLARTYFAQEDWTAARLQLATLFGDNVLGSGYVTTPDAAGNFESRENPAYWEALLKLIRSNLRLGENADAMRNLLVEQRLIYGDGLGGKRWQAEFNQLIGDLKLPATGPAPQ
ncbi:MAG TPA: hypothetical protein VF595_02315 [Tepidisphaeraceae bacterium]